MSSVFTKNTKTVYSVDFSRAGTCGQICGYCYVNRLQKMYKAYSAKIILNHKLAKQNPANFAAQLNLEYRKLKNRKHWEFLQKLPVRFYGSGDFIPEHLTIFQNIEFHSYLISKNLTDINYISYISDLLSIDKITSIVLSFDNDNLSNYGNVQSYFSQDRIQFAFTGMPSDFATAKEKYKFDIFFNIGKTKASYQEAQVHNERCKSTTGELPTLNACVNCNACWGSSKTEIEGWNN